MPGDLLARKCLDRGSDTQSSSRVVDVEVFDHAAVNSNHALALRYPRLNASMTRRLYSISSGLGANARLAGSI